MQVDKIQSNRFITPKTTGYASAVCMGTAIVSGISKNRTIRKTHKPSAYIGAILTVLHIGLIEYYHSKFKKQVNKQQ